MKIAIKSIGKKAALVITAAFAAGVGAAVVSFAAIPNSSTGVISGCYKNAASLFDSKGALRVIDTQAGQTCASGETALNWGGQTVGSVLVNNLHDTDLSNETFNSLNLAGVNFQNSDLRGSNLTGSTLTNANFSGANLGDISNVIPSSAFLDSPTTGTRFDKVNADNAVFTHLTSAYMSVGSASFQNADFSNSTILYIAGKGTEGLGSSANFQGAKFVNVVLGAGLDNVNLTSADFRGLQFQPSLYSTSQSYIENSNLTNANFSSVNLNDAELLIDNATNTNFTNAQFHNVSFNANDGNPTDSTDLSAAILTGSTWDNTTCPDGTNSDNNGNTCIGHLVP